MPNWVRNIVTFTCDEDTIEEIRKALSSEDMVFDFNKLIPMPDSLMIDEGTRSDRAEECYAATDDNEIAKLKEKFKLSDDDFDELKRLGEICASNREKYGHRSWYGWCCENWGTKWNAREAQWIDDDTMVFETAWSCPEPIFKKLAEAFPNVGICVRFADEDIGYNCGTLEYSDGVLSVIDYEPDGSYEFAFDVWDYDEESRREFLKEVEIEIGE